MSEDKKIHVHVDKKNPVDKKTFLHIPEDHDHRKDRVLLASGVTFLVIVLAWVSLLGWNFSNIYKNTTELNIGESLRDIQKSIQGTSDKFEKGLGNLETDFNDYNTNQATDTETAEPTNNNTNSEDIIIKEDTLQHLP